jgi:uncharacterized protein YggE
MIERPWGVTAYGAASVKALPDLVRVRFKIVRMEQAAPAAFEAASAEVEGVDFDVIGKGELRASARRKAVAAARAKAELYAEAAGVRLGALLHIDDVDPDLVGNERYRSHSAMSGAGSDQDLAPGHVVVSAAVTLGYALARD